MHKYSFILLVLFSGCKQPDSSVEFQLDLSSQAYLRSLKNISESNLDSALINLETAFDQGYSNPMKIILDSSFYTLVDEPLYRPQMRTLLKKYANKHQISIARENEVGRKIGIEGNVIDEDTQEKIDNVVIEFVQTDSKGLYFNENSLWNPRIFGYAKTNGEGVFKLATIYPGIYKDELGKNVPAHIHFTCEAEGYRIYASEFTFEDDSIFLNGKQNEDILIAQKNSNTSLPNYKITIPLQKAN